MCFLKHATFHFIDGIIRLPHIKTNEWGNDMHFNKKLRAIVLEAAPQLKETILEVLKADNGEMKLDLSRKVKLDDSLKLNVKTLAIGGTGGEALAIDELLMADITDRAINQFSGIFTDLDISVINSVNHRGLVELNSLGVTKGVENVPGLPQSMTPTGELGQLVSQVGKAAIITFVSQEAVRDTMNGDSVSLWDYIVESAARQIVHYFSIQIIAGDGKPDRLRGLVSSKRIDDEESLKPDHERDPDFLQVKLSGVDGDFGTDDKTAVENIVFFLNSVPSKNRANSKVYMNSTTHAAIELLSSTSPRLRFDEKVVDGQLVTTVNGFVISLDDMMPNMDMGSIPMLVGDINAAIEFAWHDKQTVVDPFSIDGAIKYSQFPRASERMKDNTALRAFKMSAEAIPAPN